MFPANKTEEKIPKSLNNSQWVAFQTFPGITPRSGNKALLPVAAMCPQAPAHTPSGGPGTRPHCLWLLSLSHGLWSRRGSLSVVVSKAGEQAHVGVWS